MIKTYQLDDENVDNLVKIAKENYLFNHDHNCGINFHSALCSSYQLILKTFSLTPEGRIEKLDHCTLITKESITENIEILHNIICEIVETVNKLIDKAEEK